MTVLSATVTLSRAILMTADGATSVTAGTSGMVGGGGQRVDTFTKDGSFRNYASGVTRLTLGSTSTRVESFTLRALTPTDQANLGKMIGKTCLWRDSYGRRIFGSFMVTATTDIPLSGGLADVTIAFQSVTYTEAV